MSITHPPRCCPRVRGKARAAHMPAPVIGSERKIVSWNLLHRVGATA
jgi:hypothetical protein